MEKDVKLLIRKLKEKVNSISEETDMNTLMEDLQQLYSLFDSQLSEERPAKDRDYRKVLSKVLKVVLTERTADYASTSRQLETLGWFARNEYLCIVLEINNIKNIHLTEESICDYIEDAIPHSCPFPHQGCVVVFINTTKAQMKIDEITGRLAYFIRDSNFKGGYSRLMIGHYNLRRQYLQSKIALEMGQQKSPAQTSYRFNEIAFDYILKEATNKLPGHMISHEKLLKLKEMDDVQNTKYISTLKVYLDNHLNAVQTAKDLSIHRSTFLYRLDKIKGILETDLEDPEEVLYLMLSFRFIEMEGKSILPLRNPSKSNVI